MKRRLARMRTNRYYGVKSKQKGVKGEIARENGREAEQEVIRAEHTSRSQLMYRKQSALLWCNSYVTK